MTSTVIQLGELQAAAEPRRETAKAVEGQDVAEDDIPF
jgi:hypothetical protein